MQYILYNRKYHICAVESTMYSVNKTDFLIACAQSDVLCKLNHIIL